MKDKRVGCCRLEHIIRDKDEAILRCIAGGIKGEGLEVLTRLNLNVGSACAVTCTLSFAAVTCAAVCIGVAVIKAKGRTRGEVCGAC